jgi:sterol desaturase/sphingolipid hydroxylase (fatty acid hydroxylase superfamily)
MILLALILGVLTWTLLEYFIHRFLGHHPKLRPNPFAAEHIRHHSEGDYFAPTWKKLLAAAAATALLAWPATWLLGVGPGLAYLAGLMSFYGVYEVLHRREHTHAGINAYGRWARRHHFAHHYSDARFNHGVTTPLWDLVFRTYRPVQTVRVPQKFVMPWLKDPQTGAVRADYADSFVLAGEGPR